MEQMMIALNEDLKQRMGDDKMYVALAVNFEEQMIHIISNGDRERAVAVLESALVSLRGEVTRWKVSS
jgi:hypothetical protein